MDTSSWTSWALHDPQLGAAGAGSGASAGLDGAGHRDLGPRPQRVARTWQNELGEVIETDDVNLDPDINSSTTWKVVRRYGE